MPTGKTNKPEEKAAADSASASAVAAAEYASAFSPKMKAKKKQSKSAGMKTTSKKPEEKAATKKPEEKAPAGGFASPSLDQEEEKSQIEKIPSGSEVRPPSLYLVVRHAVVRPAYSVYRIKHPLVSADHPLPVPCRVKYLDAEHDMSFAAVSSRRRSWIVGVGGFRGGRQGGRGQTIVFDCKTGLVAKGPSPMASKYQPVLFVVGEKVYALAHMPNVWRQPDAAPWFEVLDLSGASCVDGKLTGCDWFPLPSPPSFPCFNMEGVRINRGPPVVEVESYTVVSHYILLSIVTDPFTDEEAGTVAFDTVTDRGHYVDRQKNLPFIGEAVPYDGLYLGRSKSKEWDDITAYQLSMTKTNGTYQTPKLSIVEVPVIAPTYMSGQFFASLGKGVICAVGCSTQNWTGNEELEMDDIYMNIHTCVDAKEESKAKKWPGELMLSNKPAMYAFSVQEPIYQLIAPSLVAALRGHV
ncbi:hypothetical protein HU200_019984 [Digitaria exilis]|uniref:Uncharacterized protein n=1 Tax=Digitaria exilis TaxID=1010633 RepID=A0A835F158_9POAL|nr:hypothetical protein HU200_019984 [Digitaria exilis]CAB3463432.1 unnamed protein product [Digitaria exilis]